MFEFMQSESASFDACAALSSHHNGHIVSCSACWSSIYWRLQILYYKMGYKNVHWTCLVCRPAKTREKHFIQSLSFKFRLPNTKKFIGQAKCFLLLNGVLKKNFLCSRIGFHKFSDHVTVKVCERGQAFVGFCSRISASIAVDHNVEGLWFINKIKKVHEFDELNSPVQTLNFRATPNTEQAIRRFKICNSF